MKNIYCSQCGNKQEEYDKFCSSCGYKLNAPQDQNINTSHTSEFEYNQVISAPREQYQKQERENPQQRQFNYNQQEQYTPQPQQQPVQRMPQQPQIAQEQVQHRQLPQKLQQQQMQQPQVRQTQPMQEQQQVQPKPIVQQQNNQERLRQEAYTNTQNNNTNQEYNANHSTVSERRNQPSKRAAVKKASAFTIVFSIIISVVMFFVLTATMFVFVLRTTLSENAIRKMVEKTDIAAIPLGNLVYAYSVTNDFEFITPTEENTVPAESIPTEIAQQDVIDVIDANYINEEEILYDETVADVIDEIIENTDDFVISDITEIIEYADSINDAVTVSQWIMLYYPEVSKYVGEEELNDIINDGKVKDFFASALTKYGDALSGKDENVTVTSAEIVELLKDSDVLSIITEKTNGQVSNFDYDEIARQIDESSVLETISLPEIAKYTVLDIGTLNFLLSVYSLIALIVLFIVFALVLFVLNRNNITPLFKCVGLVMFLAGGMYLILGLLLKTLVNLISNLAALDASLLLSLTSQFKFISAISGGVVLVIGILLFVLSFINMKPAKVKR